MVMTTAYSKNDNYVITTTSNNPFSCQSHDVLVSGVGSPSVHSDYVSRRRAFCRASSILYCNKDILTTFLTLTYKKQHSNYKKILNDMKNHFSRRGIEYIAVVEKHKSGNYHIHAITTDLPGVVSLRKRKFSWSEWKQGFSDVKFISGTDEKFRVEMYIFKYLVKASKIGGRFVLTSRGLKVKRFSYPNGLLPKPFLDSRPIDRREYNIYNHNEYKLSVERLYYERQSINVKQSKNNGYLLTEREL